MKKDKLKNIDFSTSAKIIESGVIYDRHNMPILIFLCENGDIRSSSMLSDFEILKACVLFFEDVNDNINILGDFVHYGIGEYPASYSKKSINRVVQYSISNGMQYFEERLSILRKKHYDILLKHNNIK